MYNYTGQQPIPQQQTGYGAPQVQAQNPQATQYAQPVIANQSQIPQSTGYGVPQQQYLGQQATGFNPSLQQLPVNSTLPVPPVPQQYLGAPSSVASLAPGVPNANQPTNGAGNQVSIPPGKFVM